MLDPFIHKAACQTTDEPAALRMSRTPPLVPFHEAPRPPGGDRRQVPRPDRARARPSARSAEDGVMMERMTMETPEAASLASRHSTGCSFSPTSSRRFPVSLSKMKEAIKRLPEQSHGFNRFHPLCFFRFWLITAVLIDITDEPGHGSGLVLQDQPPPPYAALWDFQPVAGGY